MKYDAVSTRDAFGQAVLEVMQQDRNAVAIAADTGKSMGFDKAAAQFPSRVLNVGIAEQNMVNMAAGMAAQGKHVFVGTYAPFLTLRALEQIRTFLCYPRFSVTLGGALGGLSGSIEGVTHQGTEDIAVMRALANMQIVVPADAAAAKCITKDVAQKEGPVYVRLGRYAVPTVYDGPYFFQFGKAAVLTEGADVSLFCCGTMVYRCLLAAERLRALGIGARVVEFATIKPLDRETVLDCAGETGGVVTAEEHTVIGGLGGAVAELLSEELPTPMARVGIKDQFAQSGSQQKLMDLYGLSVQDVVDAAQKVMKQKNN